MHLGWCQKWMKIMDSKVFISNQFCSPSNKKVSTSFLISLCVRPSPFSSLAVSSISRKSRYFRSDLPCSSCQNRFTKMQWNRWGGCLVIIKGLFCLFFHKNIYCGYSLESPCRGDSNVYPQYMFLWRTDKNHPFNGSVCTALHYQRELTLTASFWNRK